MVIFQFATLNYQRVSPVMSSCPMPQPATSWDRRYKALIGCLEGPGEGEEALVARRAQSDRGLAWSPSEMGELSPTYSCFNGTIGINMGFSDFHRNFE